MKSIDFVQKEAPDVVHQFLQWRFYRSIFLILTGIGISFVCWKSSCFIRKRISDKMINNEGSWTGIVALRIIAVYILIFVSGYQLIDEAIKIKIAPKVYIMEFVIDTVKGNNQ